MKNGIYICGIIKTSSPQEFGKIGIGDTEASDVQTIGWKDIAAVVCDSPLTVYDSLTKDKVVKDLATHQFIIEKVMERFTIVPVKFGTMVETAEEVMQFLENGYALLSHELEKIAGKIELDVVAWWDLPKMLAALSRRNSQIQETQQKLARKSGPVSIEEKVVLGQLIEQALETEKTRYQELILHTLERDVLDICSHQLADNEMIFNAAFLLEKREEEAFHALVHSLDQQLESTVNFRVVGPLPPYSFSTVLLEKVDPASVEEAKKTLGLTGDITDKALRNAYHQLAQQHHPDKNHGGDYQKFQQLHSAYKTLKGFIENGLMHTKVYQWQKEVPEES